jgi:Raf kinase inhibitor-like YbhB/YbcL family protein
MPASPLPPARALVRPPRAVRAAAAAVAVCSVAACGQMIDPATEVREDVTVLSPALVEGEALPERFTCEGEEIPPPLQWSGLPRDTESVAVVMDAPHAQGGNTVLWVVFGLDPVDQELGEGGPGSSARQAQNSAGEAAYLPPCPEEHGGEYRFTVYALNDAIAVEDGAPLSEATAAIAEGTLGYGRLVVGE